MSERGPGGALRPDPGHGERPHIAPIFITHLDTSPLNMSATPHTPVTSERLRELLERATPGPWISGGLGLNIWTHDARPIAKSMQTDEQGEANVELLSLSRDLAAEVVAMRDFVELIYRGTSVRNADAQARELLERYDPSRLFR